MKTSSTPRVTTLTLNAEELGTLQHLLVEAHEAVRHLPGTSDQYVPCLPMLLVKVAVAGETLDGAPVATPVPWVVG